MENKTVKCKPGQGKFNRLIEQAQLKLRELGYPERRFKRNYTSGIAKYICPITGKEVLVNINNKEISGNALDFTETVVNLQEGIK